MLNSTKYKVVIIESEAGWGQKIDETKYFDEESKAKSFVVDFNSKNNKDYVPDWYMYAEYIGECHANN